MAKFVPITVQLGLGNSLSKLKELGREFDSFGQKGVKSSDSIRGIKEGISSLSSEVIESFGLDGDIANLFGKQIAGINATTLAAGGAVTAVVGVTAAVGALTIKLSDTAAELRSTAAATGLSTEELQNYRNAAQVAGVGTDTLTDAVDKLRERGLEAQQGNKEAAESFKLLGINAQEAAQKPQQAFDAFLNQLQNYTSDTSRANAVTTLFGGSNLELTRATIALTEKQGDLRKRLQEVGVAMDAQAVNELSALNREYELAVLQVETFAQRSLVKLVQGLNNLADVYQRNKIAVAGLLSTLSPVLSVAAALFPGTSQRTFPNLEAVDRNPGSSLSVGVAAPKSGRGSVGRSSGRSSPAAQTEAQQLANQLKNLNQQITILGDKTSEEYSLKLKIADAEEVKKRLEDVFKLRRAGFSGSNSELANFAEGSQIIRGLKLDQDRIEKRKAVNEFEKEVIERNAASLKEQLKLAELIEDTATDLADELEDLRAGGKVSRETKLNRKLRGLNLSEADAEALRASARQNDAEAEQFDRAEQSARDYADALELGRQRQEQFADFIRSQFDNLLESPKRFFDGLKQLFKRGLSDLLTGLVLGKNGGGGGGFFSNIGGNLSSLLTGGGGASGGGGGFLSNIFGGGGGGGLSSLFRTPGFNPAASGAGGGGNLLSGVGGLGNFSGLLKGGGLLGKLGGLFGLGGGGAASGATTIGSSAVASAKAALGIGGGASSGLLTTIGALASNPITIAAAAAIGGFLLYRHFRKRGQYSRDVKKAVQSQYGVEVSNDVVKQIKQIGQSRYGKDYANKISETVALPEVRDLVADYAENTGQQGNSKLFNQANLSDPFYRDNRFVVAENGRGIAPSSLSSSTGGVPAIVQAAQAGGQALLAQAITMLAEKITSIPAGEIITANSAAVGEAFQAAFATNAAIGEQIGRGVNP